MNPLELFDSWMPTGGIWDNLLCSCNNYYVLYGVIFFVALYFWILGWVSGMNVRKTL
jgi:hypothetical protein